MQRTQRGHPTFFYQSQDEFIAKESLFVHLDQSQMRAKSDWKLILKATVKGVKVDCDASIYDKILSFYIIKKASKSDFLNGGPKILQNRLKN